MQQCEANHQDCHQTSPLQAPTRLIEVSSIGEPLAARLHVSAQNSGNYLALSYCWGGPQRHALIGSKVSEYCISLPYSELPNTILDSFEVTRQLKYRYIWIDSLCMIQDDREDMLRELPKMNLIYRNADQTISVACASSCDEGFLKSRHNGLYRVPLPRLQPINERAWTLQESLLARRLLIFPGSGVYWKCDTICQSDTSSKPQSWEFQSHEYFYPAMLGEAWSRAVEGYSMRHLSFEGDKLAAISAIAANMSILFRCGYLAGLWRDDLVNGLAWEIYRSPEMPAIVHRTQSYQAPSWSWASITGPISFPEQHRRAIHKPAAEIELCDTSLVSERLPYGAVSAGTLIIRGYVNEVMIGSTENTMTTILDITLAQPTKTYMRLNLDDPSDQKLNTFLLLILFSESGIAVPKKTKAGLVLTKSSDENAVHRRVGWFDSFNESGPLAGDQWSQRVVTII
ncbi:HET-domain-containing protein [Polyplosphaeria fusca]|uniref:HET-domain-containing protein n=1 Tax=Polyplosphaeria fusca TaxID=682080 RepID=A0A9P4QJQ7_9PLEO|nr:HET-domain-containing protein [Polyplosphaeria fusca]